MLSRHKKAPALTEALRLNTRVDAPSPQANTIITLSNNDSYFMRLKDIKTGLDNQLFMVYIDFTTLNHVVRCQTLLYNSKGVQRTIKHCAFFVSMIYGGVALAVYLLTFGAYRTGLNLCSVTALIRQTITSGDPNKSKGDRKMSIPTHFTNKQHLECYLFNLFLLVISQANKDQLSNFKTALSTITKYLEEGSTKQSISDHISYFSDLLSLPSITYNQSLKELRKSSYKEFKAFYRSIVGKHNFVSIKYVLENLSCIVIEDDSQFFDKYVSLVLNFHLPRNIKRKLNIKPNTTHNQE